ncbi:hypothetical protein E5163_05325 [Marinicauda algicola]|uniref:Uncharacterized protein n=1 Tax=Marinicauda algicola TaxID=2029849 RepID=A0A4S2H4S4_9PROT|nr:hypothetical protein [Marinicauda algicola]TGY90543.1 hypothetical protein E5163_05325 [Marinicauda algicola]
MARIFIEVCITGEQLFRRLGWIKGRANAHLLHTGKYDAVAAAFHRDSDGDLDENDERFVWPKSAGDGEPAVVIWTQD